MTTLLKSYLCGTWMEGKGTPVSLVNPTTEDVIAHATTEGLDFKAALDYARTTGGNALREMNFAQRGEMIKAMSKVLHGAREELLDLATVSTGNTRSDAKFDVDGATFTLGFYARLGRELGERSILLDGDEIPLAKNPRFVGRHIYTPKLGAAVHINAFNFPAWGFAEKAAVALLAGMPVITKPATSTAVLTVRMFEILAASGCVPEGAISLISGSAGDVLDHLGPQDVLAFTGSSHTATLLRSNENLIANSVPINVEADSLNAAILGPDADSDSETYDMFLREVVRDMTQKAGQKCTAIRRIFVPADRVDGVREDLSRELSGMPVGNPTAREVKVGPLATGNQLRDVQAGVARLQGSCKTVYGDGGRGDLVGIDHDRGFFLAPVLLQAERLDEAVVHADEVFGPVATMLPYGSDVTELCNGVLAGNGGLVSSVYSDDVSFVGSVLTRIAAGHGRLHLGSAKIADSSPGPGTVNPALLHGGPGRAGGGEELGGSRSLAFYMQRTAVQGSRRVLQKILDIPKGD